MRASAGGIGRGRRALAAALALAAFGRSGAPRAPGVAPTPAQTEGPFYPTELPPDFDSDLTRVSGQPAVARGDLTDLTGTVTDAAGRPLAGVQVEIWQVNAFGRYHHPGDSRGDRPLDPGFQGYGQATTDAAGRYRFRTIRPVSYPGRAPHIHFAVKLKGRKELITQCYIKGHAANEKDGVWKGLKDEKARASVTIPFAPLKASRAGELAAKFDVVMGLTPEHA